jgi:CO/xanthine dehydrogenase FAD-binding subunit
VGAVAVVETDGGVVKETRVAMTGVWKRTGGMAQAPAQLAGKPLDAEAIEAVAQAIAAETSPRSNYLGSEEYRRAMAIVTSRDALTQCMEEK